MPKKLEIRIGEYAFEATLLEKLAPVTCATLLKCLPYEGEGVHAAWSGQCFFVLWKIPSKEKIPPENRMIYGSAGDIGWNTDPEWNEIFITYGTAQFRHQAGPIVLNLFAKITDNLEQLANVCAEMQRKGTKKVSLRER